MPRGTSTLGIRVIKYEEKLPVRVEVTKNWLNMVISSPLIRSQNFL
jgi:hypothetical protein